MIVTVLTFIITVLIAAVFIGFCILPFYLIGSYCYAFYKDMKSYGASLRGENSPTSISA
ncbi:MAG: hypothetical protein IJ144_06025 [Prevotella sp.]|nr:hypothetical protein [Prevotella sp.]